MTNFQIKKVFVIYQTEINTDFVVMHIKGHL